MKKTTLLVVSLFLLLQSAFSRTSGIRESYFSSGCSVAGTASLQQDSICYEDSTTLLLSGYSGSIQWQSFDGLNWVNESGTGATTDAYQVFPGQVQSYRAIVTNGACQPDTSNIVLLTVGVIPVPAGINTSRCGPGQVSLQGSGNGTLKWYTASTGGVAIGTGSPFNTFVSGTTTFYLEDNTFSGGGGTSPLQITELDINDDASGGAGDDIEIQNVSSSAVNVTGWTIAVSNSYTDINSVNPNVQVLNGILQPGDILSYNDVGGTNYWGSNLLWNSGAYPTFTGWAMVLDNNNVLRDFVALNWPTALIQGMVPVVNGATITIGSEWIGDGVDITTVGAGMDVSRQGNSDNNINTDWGILPVSVTANNPSMVLPFGGFGCSSPRVPVQVAVSSSASISIQGSNALCQGQSTILTASSTNSNYNYTWSPSTGLSSTTGASVTANPVTTITYTVVGDDGTCANIDSITISVGPTSVAGTATISTDTICLGSPANLNLSGYTGNIQWQSNNGSGWVNETGTGNTSPQYQVSPTVTTQYQAVVTSGGCAPATTVILNLEVLTITDPVTLNDTICGPGQASLSATGSGLLNWYTAATGGSSINTGSGYSPSISSTTTYYVEASAGGTYNVGPVTNGIGNQNSIVSADYGLQFDVTQQVTIDRVYIYPQQVGNVTINLRDAQGGPVLNTVTVAISTFGKVPVNLGFTVSPFSGYRLELATGSIVCSYNTTGAVYPYVTAGSPLSITGYVNPFYTTGPLYYYFYDWVVSEGCKSNRIPVTGVVLTPPSTPVINQNGNTLTSSSATGNQWYYNGNILPGETGQTLNITQTGNYSVTVTDANGCTATGTFNVTTIGLNELNAAGINVYPNPSTGKIFVSMTANKNVELKVFDAIGRTVFSDKVNGRVMEIDLSFLKPGTYTMEFYSDAVTFKKEKLIITK